MALTSKVGNRVTPDMVEEDLNAADGMITAPIQYHVHSIYECDNKEQFIKYYHSSLGSHPQTTLISATKRGYLRGLPGFNAKVISKFIAIEDATKIGHLNQIQKGF